MDDLTSARAPRRRSRVRLFVASLIVISVLVLALAWHIDQEQGKIIYECSALSPYTWDCPSPPGR